MHERDIQAATVVWRLAVLTKRDCVGGKSFTKGPVSVWQHLPKQTNDLQ